ncbi:hypothetical protein CR513_28224, partial [Mucuna pruriens]
MDWSMIDAASGGALMDKTPVAARQPISNMAKKPTNPRTVNEIGVVDNQRLEKQLTELMSLVRQLAIGQHQPSVVARVCGICTSVEHPTVMCPTLQEIESYYPESVGAIGDYQYGNHFGQGGVQGYMQLSDLDLPQMHLRDQQVINNRLHNIRCHHSDNSNNREFQLKAILHLLRT